jgi:GT2 family glycosyltransferase
VEPRSDSWFHALNGTSFLISRVAIEDVGLLDERFFLYWEDTEYCLRLRKKGWRIAAAPNSRVLHKVCASTGRDSLILDRYGVSSGLRLLRLYSPVPHFAMPWFLAKKLARRLVFVNLDACKSVWAGARDYFDSVRISKVDKARTACTPQSDSRCPPQDSLDGDGT